MGETSSDFRILRDDVQIEDAEYIQCNVYDAFSKICREIFQLISTVFRRHLDNIVRKYVNRAVYSMLLRCFQYHQRNVPVELDSSVFASCWVQLFIHHAASVGWLCFWLATLVSILDELSWFESASREAFDYNMTHLREINREIMGVVAGLREREEFVGGRGSSSTSGVKIIWCAWGVV